MAHIALHLKEGTQCKFWFVEKALILESIEWCKTYKLSPWKGQNNLKRLKNIFMYLTTNSISFLFSIVF